LHSEIRITAPEAIDDHLMNLMTLAHDRS
jgi:hypothetical protein